MEDGSAALPLLPASEVTLRDASAATVEMAAGPALDAGMPHLAVVLEDPRLSAVRSYEQAGDWANAARLMDSALQSATLDRDQTCTWTYAAGRLYLAAHAADDAIRTFERLLSPRDGEAPCPLAPYAAWRDAEALLSAKRYDETIARALSVGDDFASKDDVERLLGEAYAGRSNTGQAPFAVALGRTSSPETSSSSRAMSTSVPSNDAGAPIRNTRETNCSSALTRAQGIHGHATEIADAWGQAIQRCGGSESLAIALYYGGKASASAHRPAEAMERFSRVEKLFPKHRLADDARYRTGIVAQDQGDERRALALWTSLPVDYPDGDMRADALFRIALAKLRGKDLDAAQHALDQAIATGLEDVGSVTGGRSEYFRARVSELGGNSEDARTRYEAVVRQQPFSYYMLLALTRLADSRSQQSVFATVTSREPPGPFLTRAHSEFSSPAFMLFGLLLDVGEIDAARKLAAASGLTAEAVDPEVLWTVAWLLNRAGAFENAYAMTRARLSEYRHHFPSGRWRLAWDLAYPRAWNDIVVRESEAAHIPPSLAWAVMREESGFNPGAHSSANALGLMQLLPATARRVAHDASVSFTDEGLLRPEMCISLGTRYLATLLNTETSSPALAIAAYNAGAGAVRRWISEFGYEEFDVFVERIPYDETRAYIKHVLASEAVYSYLVSPESIGYVLDTIQPPRSNP